MPISNKAPRPFALFWLIIAMLWTAGSLVLALVPEHDVRWAFKTFGDKLLHGFAFAVGGFVWAKYIESTELAKPLTAAFIGAAISLAVGGAIEGLQTFTPTRQAEWGDFFADACGVLPVLIALTLSASLKRKREAPSAPVSQ